MEVFLYIVTFRFSYEIKLGRFIYSLGHLIFDKRVNLLALVGYEMIITNEARHLISNARSWNNCL